MPDLRGALIGCGFFAVNHMHAWNDVNGAQIVSICDSNNDRLRIMGDQFDVASRYSDAGYMLETERPDFVDIATTVSSHVSLVKLAASHKIPVICQKPFASSLTDAEEMVSACIAADVPLMVHENFRWQSPIMRVKRIVEEGVIGNPFWARISFRSGYDVFATQPYLAKGERFIVEDLGIHALDVARFLLGDVRSVSAHISRVNAAIKGEDVATILLDHKYGATSIVDCSYATKLDVETFPETLIEVDGDQGTIRLLRGYELVVRSPSGVRREDVSPPLLRWASRPWHNIQESVLLIQQHWVDCLKSGKPPETSGLDNLQTLGLVEAVYESARTKKTVTMAEVLS